MIISTVLLNPEHTSTKQPCRQITNGQLDFISYFLQTKPTICQQFSEKLFRSYLCICIPSQLRLVAFTKPSIYRYNGMIHRSATLLKKRLQYWFFPVNSGKIRKKERNLERKFYFIYHLLNDVYLKVKIKPAYNFFKPGHIFR